MGDDLGLFFVDQIISSAQTESCDNDPEHSNKEWLK